MTKRTIPALLFMCAGALLPSAQAVEFDVGDNAKFSAFIELDLLYLANEVRLFDPDGSVGEPEDDDGQRPSCSPTPCLSGDEFTEGVNELIDNGSSFGLEGEYTSENGLTTYFYVEWEFQADEPSEDGGGLTETSEAYIGLSGKFGATELGNSDGIYDDWILGVLDNFEYEGPTEYSFTSEAGDLLSYATPDLNGFHFAIQASIKGSGAGIDNDPQPPPLPPYAPDPNSADEIYPLMLVAAYESELFSVRLGYDDRQLVHKEAEPQIGLAATLDFESLSLGVKFEQIGESRDGAQDGVELAGIIGVFDYEVGEVSLTIQDIKYETEIDNLLIDFDTEVGDLREDRTEAILGATYILNQHLYFYFESAGYGAFEDLGDYTGLGVIAQF